MTGSETTKSRGKLNLENMLIVNQFLMFVMVTTHVCIPALPWRNCTLPCQMRSLLLPIIIKSVQKPWIIFAADCFTLFKIMTLLADRATLAYFGARSCLHCSLVSRVVRTAAKRRNYSCGLRFEYRQSGTHGAVIFFMIKKKAALPTQYRWLAMPTVSAISRTSILRSFNIISRILSVNHFLINH